MDRDRQRADHRNPHSATSSWSSDDHPALDPHRGGGGGGGGHFSSGPGDANHHQRHHFHHHRHHHSNHRQHFNFNTEQNDDIASATHSSSLSARKRQFSTPDCIDGGSYVKLYVGGIPRTATEEEIRFLFGEHGNIVEVVLLKDKRTGQQQECCFVKYATLEEADRAIGTLHNRYTFPGGMMIPIKVRYADGERERLGGFGPHEYKLYVGCLNKQACKREVEEIFSPFGLVEEVYIVCDERWQSRGCGFVQFSHRHMAVAAMNALSGTYIMRGCDQPLVVRFAEPKKPKIGESRDNCKFGADQKNNGKFGGSIIGSRFQEPFIRPAPYLNDPVAGHVLPSASPPLSPKTMASSFQSPQTGGKPQTVSGTPTASELVLPSSTSSSPAVPPSTQTTDLLDCDWSEHTCPDGYKYYYNCVTLESRWEKPEEYFFFEQQLQKQQEQEQQQQHSCLEVSSLSNPQVLSTQEVSQMQEVQLQTQLSNLEIQQPSLPTLVHSLSNPQVLSTPEVSQMQEVQLQTQHSNLEIQQPFLPTSDTGQEVQLQTQLSNLEIQQPSLTTSELEPVKVQVATSPNIAPTCV
ncbi:Flowering time control protein FCA [Camellia lanceoleosa]|uniref:Flowering time control protein FCA n=1 Tax=Camellia lanceoleosa TaxID=1840588 RepID=A0ACC0F4K8_9ERIC|nr:Flowering time control protein FCA [Camellia lanceoleosa]